MLRLLDLHILLNTVHVPSIVDSPASWIPACLPKYNSSSFLHVFVSFLRNESLSNDNPALASVDITQAVEGPSLVGNEPTKIPLEVNAELQTDKRKAITTSSQHERQVSAEAAQEGRLGIGLVCVSTGSNFEPIRTWCEEVTQVALVLS